MAYRPAQATDDDSCIYVHTAAGRGEIERDLVDSGDMWTAGASELKAEVGSIESFDVLPRGYHPPLAAGE